MIVHQVTMRRPIQNGGYTYTAGWVEYKPRLKVGAHVQCEGHWWEVTSMGQPMDSERIHRDWKVGGLT